VCVQVLTQVAEAISGYSHDLPCSVLHESALFAIFAMMKDRTKREIESKKVRVWGVCVRVCV